MNYNYVFKVAVNNMVSIHPLDVNVYLPWTYLFDCTFFRFIYLTAKALHSVTMCDFLVGVTESEKRTLKRVQLMILGLSN